MVIRKPVTEVRKTLPKYQAGMWNQQLNSVARDKFVILSEAKDLCIFFSPTTITSPLAFLCATRAFHCTSLTLPFTNVTFMSL